MQLNSKQVKAASVDTVAIIIKLLPNKKKACAALDKRSNLDMLDSLYLVDYIQHRLDTTNPKG